MRSLWGASWLTVGLVIGVALAGSGGSVNLGHGTLGAPPRRFTDTVQMARASEGIDGKVGWGRFTVFAIPIVPVYIEGNGNEKVMDQIRDALQQVGYSPAFGSSGVAATGPVLKCKVNKFWFSNYTWLFPFVPTWGGIELTTNLVLPSGSTVWSRNFSGSGFTANFFNGYTSAANQSMTKILNDMVREFASDEFHRALTQS